MVVDANSASLRRPHNKNEPLETDHSRLNKFATRDSNYESVAGEIRNLISIAIRRDPEGAKKFLDILIAGIRQNESLRKEIALPVGNTCDWAKPIVQEFVVSNPLRNVSKALVFCGGPGSGKSVLSRVIVRYLEDKGGIDVGYLIFKEGSAETSQPIPAMRRLLHELLGKNHKLYRHVEERYREVSTAAKLTLEDLFEIFKAVMSDERSKSTIIVIDGFNECDDEPQRRPGLKKEFNARRDLMDKFHLLGKESAGRFIITTQEFEELSKGFSIARRINLNDRLEVKDAVKDVIDHRVNTFLDEYLEKLRDDESSDHDGNDDDEDDSSPGTGQASPRREDARLSQYKSLCKEYEDLRPILLKNLKDKAGHMFLWVDLFMERLEGLQTTSPAQFRIELEGLPTDLIRLYVEMFARKLKGHRQAITQKLPWLLFVQNPLRRDELRDALAMQDFQKRENSHLQRNCRSKNSV